MDHDPPNHSPHHTLTKNIVPCENNHQQYKAKATNLDDYVTKTLPNTTHIRQMTIPHTPAHHNNGPTQNPTLNQVPLFLPPTNCNTATHNSPSNKISEHQISDLLPPTQSSNLAHTKECAHGHCLPTSDHPRNTPPTCPTMQNLEHQPTTNPFQSSPLSLAQYHCPNNRNNRTPPTKHHNKDPPILLPPLLTILDQFSELNQLFISINEKLTILLHSFMLSTNDTNRTTELDTISTTSVEYCNSNTIPSHTSHPHPPTDLYTLITAPSLTKPTFLSQLTGPLPCEKLLCPVTMQHRISPQRHSSRHSTFLLRTPPYKQASTYLATTNLQSPLQHTTMYSKDLLKPA